MKKIAQAYIDLRQINKVDLVLMETKSIDSKLVYHVDLIRLSKANTASEVVCKQWLP